MRTSLPRQNFSSDSGQSTLELVFCLPLFLILVLGTAEIGNLTWSSVQVNNAARAGAAYASLSRANAANAGNILLAAKAEAPNLAITFPSAPTPFCYCVDSSGTTALTTCDQSGVSGCNAPSTFQVAIQVNVQAAVTPFVHYPGLPATYTVNGQATMGVEQ